MKQLLKNISLVSIVFSLLFVFVSHTYASTPNAGGNTTVVNPSGEGAISINEDAPEPESANIRLIVPTLNDPGGGTPNSIRILSVAGGTMKQSGGENITLGASGTALSLSSSRLDLRFKPDSNRNTNASFQYVVVDPHDSTNNSTDSTATITITSINDTPLLQTAVGSSGAGLAATYYLTEWDLTGSTFNRVDSTVNFSNNFGVNGLNTEQFSVRWTGKIESPITGNVTFSTQSDDGVRLWVNGEKIIDNWTLHGTTTDTSSPVALVAGTKYDIQMEFYERGGGEVAILQWAYTGQSTQVIPQQYLYPATVRPAMTYINGSSAVVIDDAITVSDVDSTTITSGTAEISSNYQNSEDSLQFTTQNGISGSFSTGTLTLSGTATLAQYQAALRSIKYFNNASNPNSSTRTIKFRVNDGSDNSNYVFRDIEFNATNNPPVITEGTSTTVTMDEDGSPSAFSLTLNATDADYHSISWSISSPATHGTASVGNPGDSVSVSYTPTSHYFGSDSFVIQASDGAGGTDSITVNVTITSNGIDESASSSTTSQESPKACTNFQPNSPPDLFQISTSPTTATLYFTPVSNSQTYIISYGLNESADQFASTTEAGDSTGVLSYTVKNLTQNTQYYFKVRGKNNCQGSTGPWSNIRWADTTTTAVKTATTITTPTPTPKGTLKIIDQQIIRPTPGATPADIGGYDVSVTVIDNDKPVVGAQVELHSTPRKTITDKDGIARFPGVEQGNHTVKLAYDGYNGEQKITVEGDDKDIAINISVQLNPNTNTFFSKSALLIIGLLTLLVLFLFLILFKRHKNKKEN